MSTKSKEIESRTLRIQLTDGTRVNGQVNINRTSGYDRVSDLINSDRERFLVVFNATLYEKEIDNPVRMKVMFINKDSIMYCTPDETQK